MSGSLPTPGAVVDRASHLAGLAAEATDPAPVNVHVAPVGGGFDPATVELDDDRYVGENAGDLGRLAAAVDAVDGLEPDAARLNHPDPAEWTGGPWLVVEPLGGRLSTVHAGRGRLAVDLRDPPPGVDAGLRALRDALVGLLDAVRPEHEHYPVEHDEESVFTRGMTTLSLDRVDVVPEGTTVRFDVSTTPDTRADAVEALVSDLSCVHAVRYEPVEDVVRSTPPSSLQSAAEAAAERAVGDWEYEWYPEPTAFSRLPTSAKLALGTGAPGERSFDEAQYETCRELLRGTIERFGDP